MTVQNVGVNIAWTGKKTRREAFLTDEDGNMAKVAELEFCAINDRPYQLDEPPVMGWQVTAFTGDQWRVKTIFQAEGGLRRLIEDILAAEIDAAVAVENLEAEGLQPEVVS